MPALFQSFKTWRIAKCSSKKRQVLDSILSLINDALIKSAINRRSAADWKAQICTSGDADRLSRLRQVMSDRELDAYFLPLDDGGRLPWLSGITGSNADVVITRDLVSIAEMYPLCHYKSSTFWSCQDSQTKWNFSDVKIAFNRPS